MVSKRISRPEFCITLLAGKLQAIKMNLHMLFQITSRLHLLMTNQAFPSSKFIFSYILKNLGIKFFNAIKLSRFNNYFALLSNYRLFFRNKNILIKITIWRKTVFFIRIFFFLYLLIVTSNFCFVYTLWYLQWLLSRIFLLIK